MFPHLPRGQRVSRARWGYYHYRQLIPLPRTYFKVEDVRPGEDELQCITDEIYCCIDCWWNINSKGIKPEYSPVFDGERFAQVRDGFKKGRNDRQACHALICDAIHEQLRDLLDELNIGWSRRHVVQVNEHKFKAGNRVRVHGQGGVNGYCVRVTPNYVFYVCEIDIFKHRPTIRRVGNDDRVAHAHPYYGEFVETVLNWRTWLSLMQEILDRD